VPSRAWSGRGLSSLQSVQPCPYRMALLRLNAIVEHIITRISIQTAGLAFGGTGLCSYRVRGVDGSYAEHLTIEFYTVVMLLTFILLVFHHPSLFHSRLKTSLFCKSFPQ